jgi:hypothetical protein
VLLYWEVGHRIRTEVLGTRRAAYGQEILSMVSKEAERAVNQGRAFGATTRASIVHVSMRIIFAVNDVDG